MLVNSSPKHIREIEKNIVSKLKHVKKSSSELLETRQEYYDQILEVGKNTFA